MTPYEFDPAGHDGVRTLDDTDLQLGSLYTAICDLARESPKCAGLTGTDYFPVRPPAITVLDLVREPVPCVPRPEMETAGARSNLADLAPYLWRNPG